MRYLTSILDEFAEQKFVLLSGPRQVGKTTLAKAWCQRQAATGRNTLYLNWDVPADRQAILAREWLRPLTIQALVLDEFHKYARWKSFLKGLYDQEGPRLQVVVTGSARLDVFQRGGESLFGRYEALRLHPFSIAELTRGGLVGPPQDWLALDPPEIDPKLWLQLERRSGFPEPFYRDDPLQHRRWSVRRRQLLIREELREISQIKELSLVEHLALLLPVRAGAPLSVNALREELQVAHDTVNSWLTALDRLYFCFRIAPFRRRITRSLTKEQKLYLWDWSAVADEAARFENMVASHLLKSVHAWNDVGYGEFDLRYLRDKEKNEVDFLVTNSHKPIVLLECKLTDETPSAALIKFGAHLGNVPRIQLLRRGGVDRLRSGTRVVSADRYLAGLV
ncbi:MAG TPA: AAA family ATPase [Phycisphaerae bacterium]